MYVLDAVIIVCFIIGIMAGIRRGMFKQAALLIGLVITLYLAFRLRTPIATFMYKVLPFFSFNGTFKGISVLNILLYEILAFVIIFSILYLILRIILKLTGLLEKLLKATIVLGFFSSIGGAILGFIESYVIVFILLFIFSQPFIKIKGMEESWLSNKILDSTPIMSDEIKNTRAAINEIYEIAETYKNDKDTFNKKSIELFIKYGIITEENVNILIEKGKLTE